MQVLATAGCCSYGKTMCSVSICMYINVYVCILTVYDRMTVNSAAQDRETELQQTVRLQAHTKTFNAHLSEATLLVVYWPNHSPQVDVEQGASRARGTLTVAHAQRIARFHATHVGACPTTSFQNMPTYHDIYI